jgi:hypothetical protein
MGLDTKIYWLTVSRNVTLTLTLTWPSEFSKTFYGEDFAVSSQFRSANMWRLVVWTEGFIWSVWFSETEYVKAYCVNWRLYLKCLIQWDWICEDLLCELKALFEVFDSVRLNMWRLIVWTEGFIWSVWFSETEYVKTYCVNWRLYLKCLIQWDWIREDYYR